jgi:hypothetical protein
MIRKRLAIATLLVAAVCASSAIAQPVADGCSVTGETCDSHDALDAMDTRVPVPLLPMMADHQKRNMRDHLLAVQEIIVALAADDFAAIERSAGRIGFSEQMGQMCARMGAGAAGFTDKAREFHRTANTIAEAARARNSTRVLGALGATLQTCTGCHAAFRQQIVDEATWDRVTGESAPSTHP